jgi:hypothetical protein
MARRWFGGEIELFSSTFLSLFCMCFVVSLTFFHIFDILVPQKAAPILSPNKSSRKYKSIYLVYQSTFIIVDKKYCFLYVFPGVENQHCNIEFHCLATQERVRLNDISNR